MRLCALLVRISKKEIILSIRNRKKLRMAFDPFVSAYKELSDLLSFEKHHFRSMAESESSSLDINSLLSSADRNFLIRSNGHQVKISELSGQTIGLYFTISRHDQRPWLERKLENVYNELCIRKKDFEIVYVPHCDEDEQSFTDYFSEMPWLAIPFSDSQTPRRLNQLFNVDKTPVLVILDGSAGKILARDGIRIITEYGAEAFPFTQERIKHLDDEEEEDKDEAKSKKEQTLKTLLVNDSRDFLISNGGNQVPVSELEGKIVGLYFSAYEYYPTLEFTQQLAEVYEKLKEKGESFEVVSISLDDDEEFFKEGFEGMPWLALPFDDESCIELAKHFEIFTFPSLVIVGQDGKTLHSNAAKFIEEHGIQAYPFNPEKLAALEEIDRTRRDSQTLSSLLVSSDRDFLIRNDGSKVQVSELEGKVVGLYFSTSVYHPCVEFSEKLVQVHNQLISQQNGDSRQSNKFEVVLISLDDCEDSFKQSLDGMPWLALPFNDKTCHKLLRYFQLSSLPTLVIIGEDGKTLHFNAAELIEDHGAEAYPFTPERLAELRRRYDDNDDDDDESVINHPSDPDSNFGKFGSQFRLGFFAD